MTLRFSFSFAHHGRYSSFHRLLAFAPTEDVTSDATCRWARRLPGRWSQRIEWRWLRMQERLAWREADRAGAEVFHYLYPENTCYAGHLLKGMRKVIASCHQPADFIERHYRTPVLAQLHNALEAADAVAVLGPDEVPLYQELAPHARVGFVPHGIDTEWFHPGPGKRAPDDVPTVLTVGNWLRDYTTWAGVVARAATDNRRIRFRVLANPNILAEALAPLSDEARQLVEPLSGIDDASLRKLYWDASVLLLPLTAAMANNALLEAMACGTPVLTTDLPGTRAYAGDAAGYHAPSDADDAYARLSAMLDDPSSMSALAGAGRDRAEAALAWPKVIEQHARLLR